MRPTSLLRLVIVLLLVIVIGRLASAQALPNTTRLLRFPTTNGQQIVFCYAGELYTVAKEGGIARRLTSGPGYTSFPHFNADGKQLAFTSQYDGNTEVYVMPGDGGVPKRITTTTTVGRDDVSDRMGPNNIVMAWENTKPLVVFRSRMRTFNSFIGELYTAGLDGDLPQQLPVPRGGFASFSPDDSKMAYNRVFREFRTWKHYRGGMADDVWIFDFKTGQVQNLTNDPAQDICPMWGPDNRIYFISDRDGRMNLFSTDLTGKDTKQLTTFKDYDIKFPSIGKDAIVFEQAGYIWRYDLASGQSAVVPIDIKEDFASGRSALVDASKHIESVSSAPDGQRVIAVARGDLYSIPGKDGTARNLTRTSNAHERDAVWSPDGKWIAYNSDATGENELYVRSQDGKGEPTQLTSNADTYYYAAIWSPDSKKLMWADRKQRLRYLDVATKAVTQVAESKEAEIRGYDWSPDSAWVAYTVQEENGRARAYLFSLGDKKSTPVTDRWYSAGNENFSDDGKYLMMTSSRDFKPIFDQTDFNNVYRDLERVYLVTLSKETENPLGPRSDEVGKKKEKDKADDKDKDKGKDADKDKAKADKKPGEETKKDDKEQDKDAKGKKPVPVKVDLEGIHDRLVALEIPPANYTNLLLVSDRIFYMRRTVADDQAENDDDAGPDSRRYHLCSYSLEDRKETVLG